MQVNGGQKRSLSWMSLGKKAISQFKIIKLKIRNPHESIPA